MIDIPSRLRGSWRVYANYLLFFVLTACAAFGLFFIFGVNILRSQFGMFIVMIMLALFVGLVLAVIPMFQRRRARKIAEDIFVNHYLMPLREKIEMMRMRAPYFSNGAGEAMVVLISAVVGDSNYIVRMSPGKSHWPIAPTEVPFEPRPLDESDESFCELADATAPDADGVGGFRYTTPDTLPFRSIRRNIALKGGYASLSITLFFWLWAAFDLYQTGTVGLSFYFWSFLLATRLFAPATGGLRSASWYLVPRGVLVDQRSVSKDKPNLLFDRRRSNLMLHQQSKRMWFVAIGDREYQIERSATSREVELLLRTWSSEQDPPEEKTYVAMFGRDDEATSLD